MPSPPPRRRSRRLLALVLPSLLGCARSEPASVEPAPVEPASVEPASVAERWLASPSAFELIPTAEGGLLAWAGRASPGLHLEPLDAAGQALGAAASIETGSAVADVAALAVGAARAVAWSEAGPSGRRLRAAWRSADGAVRSFELGAVDGELPLTRGGVALAASGAGARLLARGAATECADVSQTACQAFQLFELDAQGARASGLSLAVPSPCASQAAQLGPASGGSSRGAAEPFEYAVCSSSAGRAALTVFGIRPSPAYAMAEEVFAGCTPLGAGRFAGEVAFVARCGAERRMARIESASGAVRVERLEPRGVVCGAAGPSLRLGAGWLRASEPLGGLELVLDEALAPPGSRAIWAGSAVVVARASGSGRLELRRHACRGAALVELHEGADAPSGAALGAAEP